MVNVGFVGQEWVPVTTYSMNEYSRNIETSIVAEDNRYHFTFDEKGCLDGILIQEGDRGRNGQFHAGTSMEEVWAE